MTLYFHIHETDTTATYSSKNISIHILEVGLAVFHYHGNGKYLAPLLI